MSESHPEAAPRIVATNDAKTKLTENFRIGRGGTVAKAPLAVKWGSSTVPRVKYVCALAFLTLCGVRAHAQVAAAPPAPGEFSVAEPPRPSPSPDGATKGEPPFDAEIRGRVVERGSASVLTGARIVTQQGQSAEADRDGRFVLKVRSGHVELAITEDQYEPLHVTEELKPGEGLRVEYRLTPLPSYKRRYQSTVRGEARHEGERFHLQDEELHQTAGTLGDPFRVIGLLPGVAAPLTLLPIYVIRGASPGTTGFFLDGMRVPQLFHFIAGGGIIHPRLVDNLELYPGVYDVSFGHYAGGIIDAETRPARTDAPAHGEIELRIYDASALVELKLPKDIKVEVAGHYGWPSFLVDLFEPQVQLSYWDFQLRADWKTLTVEVLGSYDYLFLVTRQAVPADPKHGIVGFPEQDSEERLEFYRVQIRDRHKLGRAETEVALVGGYDEFEYTGASVVKLSLALRGNLSRRWSRFRLFTGFDSELSQFTASNFAPGTGRDQPDAVGDLGANRNGVEAGAFIQGTLEAVRHRLWLTIGARADVYNAQAVTLFGIDPRFEFRARLLPWLQISGGIGLYQQPPSFPIPLPGVDTFALQLGLQRAVQAAYSVEAALPEKTSIRLTGFWEQFYNVDDAILDFTVAFCTAPPPESLTGLPARITRPVDGYSYGLEFLARKNAGRFTGWISYTLSQSMRLYSCGLRPADYDQTHVLNVVGQVRLPWQLMVGARLLVQTGRPVTEITSLTGISTTRNNVRLPTFVQLDVRLDREWLFRKWALSAFLEVVNITYSESVLGLQYPTDPTTGITNYLAPQLSGFNWILPSIGLRGRF